MPEQTIRILSWNIKKFGMNKAEKVAQIINQYNPDVFGLYEVEAAPIYNFMLDHFPDHSVFITKGQQSQEILVACRNSFEGIKFQQKDQFKSGNPYLRPGVFLTFRYPNASLYGFLFLHTDSGTSAVDFGNRNEMFEHAFNLKRKLDDLTDSTTNFIILGDLNTMGLKYPEQIDDDQIADTDKEIDYIDFESQKTGEKIKRKPQMRRLEKPVGTHLSITYGIADLDHIIASDHLQFKPKQNFGESGTFEVLLDGWRRFSDEQKRIEFAHEISDHCLLLCELVVE